MAALFSFLDNVLSSKLESLQMSNKFKLRCNNCGRSVSELYHCPICGPLKGVLNVEYDYDSIRNVSFILPYNSSIFRYLPLLPLQNIPDFRLNFGLTPLVKINDKMNKLYYKLDIFNPSLSFKDRASSVVVAYALENKYKTVITSSTGNAATSLACFCAVGGIKAKILVPKNIPKPKLTQIVAMGADVVLIDASYDDIFDLTNKITEKMPQWLNRNTAINPFTTEGKKTVTFEIFEQLHHLMPDYIVVPSGDGCILSSVWKGVLELKKLGLINKLPKLVGVQASGCSPLVEAFEKGEKVVNKVESHTFADSIAVGNPRDQFRALKAVYESDGIFCKVDDDEIMSASLDLAKSTGIFVEPSSGASHAAFKKLQVLGYFDRDSTVVVLLTGNGLKDIKAFEQRINVTKVFQLDLELIIKKLKEENV